MHTHHDPFATPFMTRLAGLALSALLTWGMLASVEGLARLEPTDAQWAHHHVVPHAKA